MAENSPTDADKQYQELERKTLDAFDRWHRFHEDLLKLGDFSSWLSEPDNQVDLVTFFALDKDNGEHYRQALTHQKQFLSAMEQLLTHIEAMFDEYETAKDDDRGGGAGGAKDAG